MKRLWIVSLCFALTSTAFASPPPSAPPEVMAAAPKDTTLLFFKTSGNQPNAAAAAVFETAADKDGVRWRTLSLFGKKDGKFVEDFSNDKLIACSMCSQFHDDQFYPDHFKITSGSIHIDQFDGGETPSQTTLDFSRKSDGWSVTKATRETFEEGRGDGRTQSLGTGPAKSFDAHWAVPWYLNTVLLNKQNGRAMFLHGDRSMDDVWKSMKGICTPETCTVLVQQKDGCISLARDSTSKFFPGTSPNPRGKAEAKDVALKACVLAGGSQCKEFDTQCTQGIF